jgi:hypothetical protein
MMQAGVLCEMDHFLGLCAGKHVTLLRTMSIQETHSPYKKENPFRKEVNLDVVHVFCTGYTCTAAKANNSRSKSHPVGLL